MKEIIEFFKEPIIEVYVHDGYDEDNDTTLFELKVMDFAIIISIIASVIYLAV